MAAGTAYNTRRNDANSRTTAQNIKIDEHKLANKKTIAVPEIANDDSYYGLIKNKREWVEQLWKVRGYKRVFIEDMLPNPDLYDVTDRDLEFLENLNRKHLANQQVRPEDFQRIVEILETQIGQNVAQGGKKAPAAPYEHNRLDLERAKAIIKDSKELAQFTKTATFNSAFDEIYHVEFVSRQYWDELRTRHNHPMLRRFWKNFLKAEEKQLRRAFHEFYSEQRIRTRGSEAEKQAENLIGQKFSELSGQMETAKSMIEMVTFRETLKNLQLEYSMKSNSLAYIGFYAQIGAPAECPSLNSETSELDVKSKFLPKVKKARDLATKKLEPIETGPNLNIKPVNPTNHNDKPKPPQNEVSRKDPKVTGPVEDDMTYFVCSLITAMYQHGFTPKDLTLGATHEAFNQQFKRANQRPTGPLGVADPVGPVRADPPAGRMRVTGGNRNIQPPRIRKRYGRHGQLWIDRLNLVNPRDHPFMIEYEDPRLFTNQLMMSSSNTEDKLAQLKQLRYQELEDYMCFEDKDDDIEGLSSNFLGAFKKFQNDRKKS